MMQWLQRAVILACSVASTFAMARDEPTWSSKLDYTLNASRDAPIVCKQGDIERQPGRTLAQVFGEAWPLQPEPATGSERVAAQVVKSVRPRSAMRGMPVQPGVVVYAVLVDATGAPLQVEVLCSGTEGYDKVARRIALQSKYRPAVINGVPVISVTVDVQKFAGGAS